MERMYFDLDECGVVTRDDQGYEMPNEVATRAFALKQARAIMAEEVTEGRLCVSCFIEVFDKHRQPVMVVTFREALTITGL